MERQARDLRLAVIGQGYVGLPLAIEFSKVLGTVIGVEIDEVRAELLKSGQSFTEDVPESELQKALESGRLKISTSFESLTSIDVVVICVPTPLTNDGLPDLSAIDSCIQGMASLLPAGTLVVNESTSYPGTLRGFIAKRFSELRGCNDLLFASAPERIDPSNGLWGLRNTPRVVAGIDKYSTDFVVDIYSAICDKVIAVSQPEVAETAKLLENTFRQVNIALINQISEFCSAASIDVFQVIEAASSKPYGFMPFFPGAGVGGHCIPVDPMYLHWKSAEVGVDLELIAKSQAINENRPKVIAQKLKNLIFERDSSILIVGMGYKSGVGDLRHSPAQSVFIEMSKDFDQVKWFDPRVSEAITRGRVSRIDGFEIYVVFDNVLFESFPSEIYSASLVLDCSGRLNGLKSIKVI